MQKTGYNKYKMRFWRYEMDIIQAMNLIMGEHYYSVNDLRYNQKIGVMYSKDDFNKFLAIVSSKLYKLHILHFSIL